MRAVSLVLAVGLLGCPLVVGSAGERTWYLEFTHEAPGRVSLGDEDMGDVDVYWYLVYRIRNPDEEAHKIFIDVTAEDDKGATYHDSFQPLVVDAVKEKIGEGPDIELWSQADVTSPPVIPESVPEVKPGKGFDDPIEIALPSIPAGEEKRCVAVFHHLSPEMDRLTVRFHGLTNYIEIERTEDHQRLVREQVYELVYERPGDEFAPSLDAWTFVGEGWKTVERTIRTDLW